jgi:hypothetical protein
MVSDNDLYVTYELTIPCYYFDDLKLLYKFVY